MLRSYFASPDVHRRKADTSQRIRPRAMKQKQERKHCAPPGDQTTITARTANVNFHGSFLIAPSEKEARRTAEEVCKSSWRIL